MPDLKASVVDRSRGRTSNVHLDVGVAAFAHFLVAGAVDLPARFCAASAGLGMGAATLAFAAYVAGLVPVLLLLGGLSDRVGRNPPILVALALAATAAALLLWRPSLEALGLARFLLGVATGLTAGMGTAYMVELMSGCGVPPVEASRRGAFVVAASTALGFGTGALATGLWLIWIGRESLTPGSYWAYLPLAALGFLGLPLLVPERREVRATAWVRLPVFPPGTQVHGAAILIARVTVGLVISVFPAALSIHGLAGWSGLSAFLVISTGLLVQPWARRMPPVRALRIGLVLVPVGSALLAPGAVLPSLPLVLVGAMIVSCAAHGFTYLGGLAAVSGAASEATRARAASGYFLFAHLGFSVPVVASGVLDDAFGPPVALLVFGVATTLASLGVAVALWRGRVRPS